MERTHATNKVEALGNEFDAFKEQKIKEIEDLREDFKKQKLIAVVVCTLFSPKFLFYFS